MFEDLPPLAQLRAFAAFTATGSVSKAGAALNVSHAAISQQIRGLEAHLGVALTQKSGRGVVLTVEGARLGQVLTQAFGGIADEIAALSAANTRRPLQISTTPMFAATWLMPRLAGFRAAHPDIDLMLNPTPAVVALGPAGPELAIRYGKGAWPGVEATLLFKTEFVIVGAKSLVGDRVIATAADLQDFPWLQEIGTSETNDVLLGNGVTGAKVERLTQMPGNLILDAVRAGMGIAAATRASVAADLARGDIVVLFEDVDRGVGFFLVQRPGVLRPSAKAFARWIHREAQAERQKPGRRSRHRHSRRPARLSLAARDRHA